MSDPFELSSDELTLGDLEDLETVLGCAMEEAQATPGMRLRMSSAMIWIRRRKIDPTFTFEDARAMTISPIDAIAGTLQGSEDPVPLDPPEPLSTVA